MGNDGSNLSDPHYVLWIVGKIERRLEAVAFETIRANRRAYHFHEGDADDYRGDPLRIRVFHYTCAFLNMIRSLAWIRNDGERDPNLEGMMSKLVTQSLKCEGLHDKWISIDSPADHDKDAFLLFLREMQHEFVDSICTTKDYVRIMSQLRCCWELMSPGGKGRSFK